MSKLPSMPFMVDTYLADTTHLTLEEHGAYLLLLMAMWRRNGQIPDDDRDNARMLGLTPRAWLRLKPRLMPFLQSYGGFLTQKRLQEQWNFAQENRARQSEKGKRGAEARREKDQILRPSRGYGTGNATVKAEATSTGDSTSSNRKMASISNKNITSTILPTVAREAPPSALLATAYMQHPTRQDEPGDIPDFLNRRKGRAA
jgi:uncharacterized protein YdaU (DUF1376 family)